MPRVSEVRISIFNAIVNVQWNLYITRDQGKSPLNRGLPWMEVGLWSLLLMNQTNKLFFPLFCLGICYSHYFKQLIMSKTIEIKLSLRCCVLIPTSAIHRLKWDCSSFESCRHILWLVNIYIYQCVHLKLNLGVPWLEVKLGFKCPFSWIVRLNLVVSPE